LIGPGGKTIRGIQEHCGVTIDVDEDGTVTIAGADFESVQKALGTIEGMTGSVEIGKVYDGKVTSVKDFGAFVEILPGRDGLCHISELSNEYVASVSDICQVGDRMAVRVIAVDEQDRIKLSRRAAMVDEGADSDGQIAAAAGGDSENGDGPRRGGGGGGGRGGRGGGGGGRRQESRR
jgi:polyribonucleotide nucleotidyltransferase